MTTSTSSCGDATTLVAQPRRKTRFSPDIGLEALCVKCEDFWPLTTEFFFARKGQPHSWCKACYLENPKVQAKRQRWIASQKHQRAAKPASQHSMKPIAASIEAATGLPLPPRFECPQTSFIFAVATQAAPEAIF